MKPTLEDTLEQALLTGTLKGRAAEIVTDMLSRAAHYDGRLTPRQASYAQLLLDKATQPAAARKAQAERVDLTRITRMFDVAATNLKRPFVNFLVEGREFKLSPAGANSRNPGYLYLKAAGEYLGKIAPDGEYQMASGVAYGPIYEALKAFAKNPSAAALAYGQATGSCCFCARELTDPRSVEAGYGPICAANWGLPWGESAVTCDEVAA
jgi:hypothetical protein